MHTGGTHTGDGITFIWESLHGHYRLLEGRRVVVYTTIEGIVYVYAS